MKFKIVYDKNNILRVRAGKKAFTQAQGYGIARLLTGKKGIKAVKVSSVNGSIYLEYVCKRIQVLKYLANIKKSDLVEVEPTQEELSRETDSRYINKIIKKVATRFFCKLFLPLPLHLVKIVYEGLPYLALGADSLMHLRLDVDLLDATSIFVTLSQGMIGPAGSIVFLLGLSEILEEYTIEKTKHSLEKSLMLNINKVWIETEEGRRVGEWW